jgi:hypothetical protein
MLGQCQISPIMFCIVCLEFVVCFISEKNVLFHVLANAQPCVYMSFNPVYREEFLKIKSVAVSFFESVLQSGINAQD